MIVFNELMCEMCGYIAPETVTEVDVDKMPATQGGPDES